MTTKNSSQTTIAAAAATAFLHLLSPITTSRTAFKTHFHILRCLPTNPASAHIPCLYNLQKTTLFPTHHQNPPSMLAVSVSKSFLPCFTLPIDNKVIPKFHYIKKNSSSNKQLPRHLVAPFHMWSPGSHCRPISYYNLNLAVRRHRHRRKPPANPHRPLSNSQRKGTIIAATTAIMARQNVPTAAQPRRRCGAGIQKEILSATHVGSFSNCTV